MPAVNRVLLITKVEYPDGAEDGIPFRSGGFPRWFKRGTLPRGGKPNKDSLVGAYLWGAIVTSETLADESGGREMPYVTRTSAAISFRPTNADEEAFTAQVIAAIQDGGFVYTRGSIRVRPTAAVSSRTVAATQNGRSYIIIAAR